MRESPFRSKPNVTGKATKYSREAALIICLVLLVVMFSVTAVVARTYHKKVHALADDWFARGESAFRAGDLAAAETDYRNALVYSPNNPLFQFHLARGLAASGQIEQSRAYLVNLLGESPGSGNVNLQLARIAARQGDTRNALLYYHSALYGVWDKDPLMMRWQARRELCEYLLNKGDVGDAEPDLVALSQVTPAGDVPREISVGKLLLRAGMWARALDVYVAALKADPRNADAIEGAGRAEFQVGHYAHAIEYFETLPPERREQSDIANMLQVSRATEAADPLLRGLSAGEKAHRTALALTQASARISDCAHQQGVALSATPATTELQKLFAQSLQNSRAWGEKGLAAHPDQIDAAITLVFEMEDTATQECGPPPAGPDRILQSIETIEKGTTP